MNTNICNCKRCVEIRNKNAMKVTIKIISMQQEFEATCFMYEQ